MVSEPKKTRPSLSLPKTPASESDMPQSRAPKDCRQAMVRRQSVVNIENFRRQYARRRWKFSFRIVALCNHLTRLMKKPQGSPEAVQETFYARDCESDQEEEVVQKRTRTRKRSSTS